jgi:hypothetical protein
MTLYCGIDLHSNNSMISLIDDRLAGSDQPKPLIALVMP